VFDAIPSAVQALRANKGRSLLTTLGIIIGVAAVIAIVAMGQGASGMINTQLAGLGPNLLVITSSSPANGGVHAGAGSASTLKTSDPQAVSSTVTGLTGISPVVSGSAQLISSTGNWSTTVQGVAPEYLTMNTWTIADGASFTSQDNAESKSVAVIGQTVATNLFPNGQSPVGQQIRIRNVPVTVVGVLASKGGLGPRGDQDDIVMVPFQSAQVRLFGPTSINTIVVQVADPSAIGSTSDQITAVLRQQHHLSPTADPDFTINNNADLIARVSSISSTLTALLGGVAGVSLVVGGVGIMNIMLVSVTERTREIGIRLAIGAQPSDVLMQFLVEAVVLAMLGDLVGILIGCSAAVLFQLALGWSVALPLGAIALAFGVSASIGMFFGIYPARKASRLDPIVALRSE
jgi:putative ABC transport system permease protein